MYWIVKGKCKEYSDVEQQGRAGGIWFIQRGHKLQVRPAAMLSHDKRSRRMVQRSALLSTWLLVFQFGASIASIAAAGKSTLLPLRVWLLWWRIDIDWVPPRHLTITTDSRPDPARNSATLFSILLVADIPRCTDASLAKLPPHSDLPLEYRGWSP